MTDIISRQERSALMSRVRAEDTGPELALRKALWASGLRYRLHLDLPGKPDLAFIGPQIAVFVDGCFWHGCPEHGEIPKTNRYFWQQKLRRNQERDAEVDQELVQEGWAVLRFWEHEIESDLERVVEEITAEVTS